MTEPGCGVSLLLHSLQSPINVGVVLCVAETFGLAVDIWDEEGLFADPGGDRGAFRLLDHRPAGGVGAPGRQVATCLGEDSVALTNFHFAPDDRIAIGNEYVGLPHAFIG